MKLKEVETVNRGHLVKQEKSSEIKPITWMDYEDSQAEKKWIETKEKLSKFIWNIKRG